MSMSEEETVESKKFYAIKVADERQYVSEEGKEPGYFAFAFGSGLKVAKRFETPAQAGAFLGTHVHAKGWLRPNNGVSIIRVTEVPGKTAQVKLVSKTKIDATKPVVHFNPESGIYTKRGFSFGERALRPADGLQDATVYPSLDELLVELRKTAGRRLADVGFFANAHVHQVELVTTPSTFIEEVVA